jgi:hypothetical protein
MITLCRQSFPRYPAPQSPYRSIEDNSFACAMPCDMAETMFVGGGDKNSSIYDLPFAELWCLKANSK